MSTSERPSSRRRANRRWALVALLLVYVVTRLFLIGAARSDFFFQKSADVTLYGQWAGQIVDEGQQPYTEFAIPYPPGTLPAIGAAELGRDAGERYHYRFVWAMAALDVAAFAGLVALSRRGGSRLGPWMWVAGTVLLGPIIYLRLDLLPALATVWAVQRASMGGWFGTGGWLSLGALAKLTPALFLPLALAVSPQRWRLLAGAAVVGLAGLAPFAGTLPALWRNVGAYHLERGLEVESTWAVPFQLARAFGERVLTGYSPASRSVEVLTPVADAVATLALLVTVAVVVALLWWLVRRLPRGGIAGLAVGMFAVIAVALAVTTVFSPQFAVWLLAPAAAATCYPLPAKLRTPILGALVVAGLTQAVFIGFSGTTPFDLWVGTLTARNAAMIGVAVLTVVRLPSLWEARGGASRAEGRAAGLDESSSEPLGR
jgi:hypothetical protein